MVVRSCSCHPCLSLCDLVKQFALQRTKLLVHQLLSLGQDQLAQSRALQAIDFAQMPDLHHDLITQQITALHGARAGCLGLMR